jgi:hypothetical protein
MNAISKCRNMYSGFCTDGIENRHLFSSGDASKDAMSIRSLNNYARGASTISMYLHIFGTVLALVHLIHKVLEILLLRKIEKLLSNRKKTST